MGEKSWKIPLWLVKSQWDPRRQQNVNGSPLVWNACAGRHICHKHPTFPQQLGSLADVGSNGSTPCFKNTWCLGTITISDPSTFLGLNMSLKSKPQNSDIKNLGSSEILVRLDAFSVKIGDAHPIPSRHKWWHSSAPRIPLTPHAIRPPRRSPRMTKSGENRHAKPWFLRGILWWDRVMGWFWDDFGMILGCYIWDLHGILWDDSGGEDSHWDGEFPSKPCQLVPFFGWSQGSCMLILQKCPLCEPPASSFGISW